MKIHTYDKVKWHYPDGKACPDLDHALKHFHAVAAWLEKNNLLSSYGKEIVTGGIDSEFSLTSEMLTEIGNQVLMAKYDEWLNTVTYDKASNMTALETELRARS